MSEKPLLRLHVKSAAESSLRRGHPWLFSDSIIEQNREGIAGELGAVYDKKNAFLAIGLYDPESPIRLRVLHAGKPKSINQDWWRVHWNEALVRRQGLFDERTTGYRCINGESDGWPGLVLDRYGDTWVLKIYTAAWLPRLADVVGLFRESFPSRGLVLRLSRNIQTAATKANVVDGQALAGDAPVEPVVFCESGIKFEADVVRGQKTGFFLDQRENRREGERLSAGRAVLNAFSFSGGFSLYAARGGAVRVDSLDLSSHALASARNNFSLNEDDTRISSCVHQTIQADAFEWLARGQPAQYDLVILDPPSLAIRDSARESALKGYAVLIRHGVRLLRPGGILVAASCSAHVTAAEFLELVRRVSHESGRRAEELLITGHPPDHPATFKEAEYLKCIYLRFE